MADERDEIRERINIVDLVGQSVLLKKTGKSWKGLCPFHADKNPSFTVDPTLGTYRCWSCGEHGDIFTWVMKTRHIEFVEALRLLADQAGVTLASHGPTVSKTEKSRWAAAMQDALAFFRDNLAKNEAARSYCESRGLSEEAVTVWEIGYAPDVGDALAAYLKKRGHSLPECKELFLVDEDSVGGFFDKFRGRLIFPIRSEGGELVAFGGRLLGEGHPKYINSGDTPLYRKSKVLYGMHRAKETLGRLKRAVLVEGYLDVIACHAAGVTGAVASLGTALAEDHARLLKRWCEQVVILYDADAAGQKAADRAVEILREAGLRARVAMMPPGEDPDTLLRTVGPAAVAQAVESGLRPLDYKIQKLKAAYTPDQDEFWIAAVEALATASNPLEEDKHLVELAAMYPGATEQVSAQKLLRAQVRAFRKSKRRFQPDEEAPRAANPFQTIPLHASELAIFRGMLEPDLRNLAWNVCGDPDLFATDLGRQVAEAVRRTFPAGAPSDKPSVWTAHIEPDELREAFTHALHDPRLEGMTPTFLEEAVGRLRRLRQRRELHRSKAVLQGDDRLRDVFSRLKQSQTEENPEAS